MNRRHFLASTLALPWAAKLYAAPSDVRMLMVFLRGGYDTANVLVPVSSDFYYQARPTIAVKKTEALQIDSEWGLHPALKSTIYPMWEKGEAAFVPFAGAEDGSRSHFETQDSIELGQPMGTRRDYGSGFLNRLALHLEARNAISFTNQLPIVLRGEAKVANVAILQPARVAVDRKQSDLIAEMYQGTSLAAPVADGFAARDTVMREIGKEMEEASRNAPQPANFNLAARRVARLMKTAYGVGFVDVGGWDTHVNEGGAQGQLANRLTELGNGLAAFADEMGPAWRDTVVVVVSEFGRTFRENGNRGTDHGRGTALWLLGGAVRGKRLAGEQVRVERASLFEDRDYPVLNEYRSVLGGLFRKTYSLNVDQVAKVFPGARPADLQLV